MSKGKWVTLQRAKKKLFIFEKLPLKFKQFIERITDKDPQFCFVCGFYIPFSQRNSEFIKKPTKNSEPCHENCFNMGIKFDDIHSKLNEDSELICWIDRNCNVHNQPLCRNRVRNNTTSIMYHLKQKHPELVGIFEHVDKLQFQEFRKEHFLRPNGRNF